MWQGKCVVLALGGCGVKTGRETRRGGQWRCWGCVRISGFFLGTLVLHVQWQTLNQDQVRIVGVPRGKCYQGSSFGWWDGLVSSHVSSLEMKHICKTQEIENKSLRDSELGVDGPVELQLWRHKNSWGRWLWLRTHSSRTAICLEVGESFQKRHWSGVGCEKSGLYSLSSGSGRGIQKIPGKSIRRLQLRSRIPPESQLALNIGDAGLPFESVFLI